MYKVMILAPKKAKELRARAMSLRLRAEELENEAFRLLDEQATQNIRQANDKLVNRKQALGMLWFTSYPALRKWEKRMIPYGYLRFEEDKILRSEVLRFVDDYKSGKINRLLHKP